MTQESYKARPLTDRQFLEIDGALSEKDKGILRSMARGRKFYVNSTRLPIAFWKDLDHKQLIRFGREIRIRGLGIAWALKDAERRADVEQLQHVQAYDNLRAIRSQKKGYLPAERYRR